MRTFENQNEDVVARTQALLLGRRRRRPSAEVWSVCEKTPLPRDTRRRTGASVAAQAYTSSPERGRFRPGARGCGRPTTPAGDYKRCRPRRPCVRPNLRGYKRPSLPFSPHFASIRSFLAWTCPLAAPCKNLTDRTLAFFSYCVIFLYEPHKRTVDHLHILDYERPYDLLSILQKRRGGGKRQRSGSHGLRGYRMDIQ